MLTLLLTVVLLDIQLRLIMALFTVEVLQPRYSAKYGSDVIMECRFPVSGQINWTSLSVSWEREWSQMHEARKEVYKLHQGQEDLRLQDISYRGRATVLHQELQKGRSVLHIANVKLTDAGLYLCVIDYGAADYKYVTLVVEAPYKKINLQERRDPENEVLILTCQAEGYPLADVYWHNEQNPNNSLLANTTHELTKDGLFHVTSILRFKQPTSGNYSCVFWNKELNEKTSANVSVFLLDQTGESATGKKSLGMFVLPICLLVLIPLLVYIFITLRRKPMCLQRGKRNKWCQIPNSR